MTCATANAESKSEAVDLYRLRDERKFSSVEELKTQISRDVHRAERYFEHTATKHILSVV